MRLEVTRKSDLAICALVALNGGADRTKAAELAAQLEATLAFTAQVLTELVSLGWVRSSPGPTGGYQLAVDASELSVIDVIEGLEGPTDNDRCVVANSPCGKIGYCSLHAAWTEARAVLTGHLRSLTIADMGDDLHSPGRTALSVRLSTQKGGTP